MVHRWVGVVRQRCPCAPWHALCFLTTRAAHYAGNIWVVPIVKCIGLGLGLVLWSSTNMLSGALLRFAASTPDLAASHCDS